MSRFERRAILWVLDGKGGLRSTSLHLCIFRAHLEKRTSIIFFPPFFFWISFLQKLSIFSRDTPRNRAAKVAAKKTLNDFPITASIPTLPPPATPHPTTATASRTGPRRTRPDRRRRRIRSVPVVIRMVGKGWLLGPAREEVKRGVRGRRGIRWG